MDEARIVPLYQVGENQGALHVDPVGHRGIELARFEGAIADAVEDRAEAEAIEQGAHTGGVFFLLRDDVGAGELPRLMGADADDLAGVFALEVVKRVKARDAGDAGDEQRQAVTQHSDMIAGRFTFSARAAPRER